ncbi:MAG: aminotransferase class I/II-fold pyridoxal phosphate-dependent enzyme [Promethearchaeota archaeon]
MLIPKIKTADHLASIKTYSGVKPLETIAEELNIPLEQIIKLDGNENPFDPLPEVLGALRSLTNIGNYPDMLCSNLIQVLGKKEKIDTKNFIISSGSDELIELLMKAYANPSDKILSVSPTFGMISFLAQVNGIKNLTVSQKLVKKESFAKYVLNEDQFLEEALKSKIIFIARPNNPDGSVVSESFIERLVSLSPPVLVVIDEAYIEFSDSQSLAKWARCSSNF